MKHDPYFKYLVAVIVVGVLLAIAAPTPVADVAPATIAANR